MREIKNLKWIIGTIILISGLGTTTGFLAIQYINEAMDDRS